MPGLPGSLGSEKHRRLLGLERQGRHGRHPAEDMGPNSVLSIQESGSLDKNWQTKADCCACSCTPDPVNQEGRPGGANVADKTA
jgi:hypothetical protein